MPRRTADAERLLPADYFKLFGLAGGLDIDLNDLQERYYRLSRKWHPDLFARKTELERKEAEEATAGLNAAYRTLKDPVRRAEYVLSANGLGIANESPPADLLDEVFELNMALEELRAGDDTAKPELAEAEQRFVAMRNESDTLLQTNFETYDGSEKSMASMRAILNRRKYICNLLRDVQKELIG